MCYWILFLFMQNSFNHLWTKKNIKIIISFRFEDGTLPFLSILSLRHGFDTIKRLNLDMDLISKHTFSIAKYVFYNLAILHHSNGKPVAVLYHDSLFESRASQGGIVNFNLLRPDGEYVGYAEVSNLNIIEWWFYYKTFNKSK